jgi:hypothetical protein
MKMRLGELALSPQDLRQTFFFDPKEILSSLVPFKTFKFDQQHQKKLHQHCVILGEQSAQ